MPISTNLDAILTELCAHAQVGIVFKDFADLPSCVPTNTEDEPLNYYSQFAHKTKRRKRNSCTMPTASNRLYEGPVAGWPPLRNGIQC